MTSEHALEWAKAGVEYVKYLAPVIPPLIWLALRLRWMKQWTKKQMAQRPERAQVDELITNGLSTVEERLLQRIRGLDARLHECESRRDGLLEQNERLVRSNARLVERIEKLLAKQEGGI